MSIDGYVSSHLATIKAKDNAEDKFLYYLLTTIDAKDLMQNIAYPSLKLADIKLIPILLPPLPQQKAIVSILDKAFKVIDIAKKNTEQNLKNVKELFDSYLNDIFENKGDDWEEKRLDEIATIYNGNSINEKVKKDRYLNSDKDGLPYIGTKDIGSDNIANYNNGVTIIKDDLGKFKKGIKNSVLICSEGGSAGRKMTYLNQDVCFGNKLLMLKLNEGNSKIIYYYYHTDLFQSAFRKRMTGIIEGISINKFKDLSINLPPLPQQKAIVSKLDNLSQQTKKLELIYQQKLEDLEELRKSILKKAFDGGLDLTKELEGLE